MNLRPEQPDNFEPPDRRAGSTRTLRQMEQVTAPGSRQLILSDETAVLRENWLALAQLLDANTPSVDEAALLSKVRCRVGRQVKRRRWQHTGLALAAASLLLAVGVAWLVSQSSVPPTATNPNPAVALTPRIEPPAESPGYELTTELDDAYWYDDLADDLAQTQLELANIQLNWTRSPDPMAWMQFQLNEFEQALGDSSL